MNLEELCKRPGPEGVVWRLVRVWDPDVIDAWIRAEMQRGTSPIHLCAALADVMSGAAFVFGHYVNDKRESVLGDSGLLGLFRQAAAEKVMLLEKGATPQASAGRIIRPN